MLALPRPDQHGIRDVLVSDRGGRKIIVPCPSAASALAVIRAIGSPLLSDLVAARESAHGGTRQLPHDDRRR